MQMDLVFIVDQGVSTNSWDSMVAFIVSILNGLDIGENAARVGFIRFAGSVENVFFLISYDNREDIINTISGLTPTGGADTNAQAAFFVARTSQFTVTNGDRSSASNIVIYVTDSLSTIERDNTLTEAGLLKSSGVTIFTIGIENLGESFEIVGISSQPQEENVNYWIPNSFELLDGISSQVLEQVNIVSSSRFTFLIFWLLLNVLLLCIFCQYS